MIARSRAGVFLLLALLVFIAHFVITAYAAERLTKTLNREAPVEQRFAPSYAVALCTVPLLRLKVLNDVVFAILIAFVLVFFRWRTIVTLIIMIPLLLLGGMFGAAVWLEHRTARIWSELGPHPTGPPIRGELASSLGSQPIPSLASYLARQIDRDDPRIDPLPQDVDWFLVAHRAEIDAVRRQLPASSDPAQLFRMQKVLLVDALQTGAWDEVEAAQRIADKLLQEPRHQEVLYAIAAYDNQLGVMRKLEPPANVALPSFDPHQRLIDAIAAQAARIGKMHPPWYAQPYGRLCIAESVNSAAREAKAIRDGRGRGTNAPDDAEASPRVPFNPTGVLNGGARLATRANKLLLDREETAVSLAARKRS
jgi:hypothetical protein